MNKLDVKNFDVTEINYDESKSIKAGSLLSYLIGYIVGLGENLNDRYNDAIPDGWIGPRR